jgi:hypothetical protein
MSSFPVTFTFRKPLSNLSLKTLADHSVLAGRCLRKEEEIRARRVSAIEGWGAVVQADIGKGETPYQ